MKHLIFKLTVLFLVVTGLIPVASCQDTGNITLPTPDQSGGKPLMQCLMERQSNREFSSKELTLQELSNLLWAAYGINRLDEGKHTTPTSMNTQNMEVYVVMPAGIYKYEEKENNLKLIASGNFMKLTGKQDFVENAALNVVIVSDFEKLGNKMSDIDKNLNSGIHAGAIMQNIYLYCASTGLNTVTRRYFEPVELGKVMKLGEKQIIMLCQTVGHKK
jgi:SagB-type dehydrogenase family enzyme